MENETKDIKEIVRGILSEATDLTDNKVSYITNVQLYFSANEIILDFYYMGPSANPMSPKPQAQRLHRILLPYGVAKDFSELLRNGISKWEDDFGVTLPIESRNTDDKPTEPSELSGDKSND